MARQMMEREPAGEFRGGLPTLDIPKPLVSVCVVIKTLDLTPHGDRRQKALLWDSILFNHLVLFPSLRIPLVQHMMFRSRASGLNMQGSHLR